MAIEMKLEPKLLTHLESWLSHLVARALEIPFSEVDPTREFSAHGLDLVDYGHITRELESHFGPLNKALLYTHSSVSALAAHLAETFAERLDDLPDPKAQSSGPIALHRDELGDHPHLAETVARLHEQYRYEASVSRGTRTIAPHYFIAADRRCYFQYALRDGNLLLYSYTGSASEHSALLTHMLDWSKGLG